MEVRWPSDEITRLEDVDVDRLVVMQNGVLLGFVGKLDTITLIQVMGRSKRI